jgi:hypothetical protein
MFRAQWQTASQLDRRFAIEPEVTSYRQISVAASVVSALMFDLRRVQRCRLPFEIEGPRCPAGRTICVRDLSLITNTSQMTNTTTLKNTFALSPSTFDKVRQTSVQYLRDERETVPMVRLKPDTTY